MKKALLVIGGIFMLLGSILHLFFWKLGNWAVELPKIGPDNQGIVQMLNIGSIYFTLFSAIITFVIAKKNALAIGAGHSFIIMMKECFPINVLNAIRGVPEVCCIFCATANPTTVVMAEHEGGRGIMGIIDGKMPSGIESPKDIEERRTLLRKFGYKL